MSEEPGSTAFRVARLEFGSRLRFGGLQPLERSEVGSGAIRVSGTNAFLLEIQKNPHSFRIN
jgi:hypothetical protein